DLSERLFSGVAARAEYTFIDNRSNLALFDHRRHIATVGLQITFLRRCVLPPEQGGGAAAPAVGLALGEGIGPVDHREASAAPDHQRPRPGVDPGQDDQAYEQEQETLQEGQEQSGDAQEDEGPAEDYEP